MTTRSFEIAKSFLALPTAVSDRLVPQPLLRYLFDQVSRVYFRAYTPLVENRWETPKSFYQIVPVSEAMFEYLAKFKVLSARRRAELTVSVGTRSSGEQRQRFTSRMFPLFFIDADLRSGTRYEAVFCDRTGYTFHRRIPKNENAEDAKPKLPNAFEASRLVNESLARLW